MTSTTHNSSNTQRSYQTAIAASCFIGSLLLPSMAVAQSDADAAKPTLTVYTYDSFIADWGPGPKVVEKFEESCNCTVDMRGVTDSLNLLTRLRFEGDNTDADVILGLDNNTITEADSLGVIAQHDVDLTALDMPIEWTSKTFIPFDYGYFSFVYDSENDNITSDPTSFKEFLAMDNTIIIQDPRTSTPGLGLVTWIKKLYGDEANEIWQQLNDRIVVISPGWGEAYSLFLQGDGDFVLSYTTSPGYHLIEEGEDNYRAAIFEEGHYLQIEAAAMTTASKQPELANQFLQFLVSPEAQSIISQGNWMYPVAAPNPGLPANYPAKPDVPSLSFSSDEVFAHRADWIQDWLTSIQ